MYFSECKNLDELKSVYRKLVLKNHPDLGGDTETMKRINAEYESAFNRLKAAQNRAAAADATGKTRATSEAPEDFVEILNKLIKLEGLKIELCGRWLWISGETMRHKDALKAAGCRWASTKKMWSWHFPEDGERRSRGRVSMDQIREKYGSTLYASESARAVLGARV